MPQATRRWLYRHSLVPRVYSVACCVRWLDLVHFADLLCYPLML